MGKDKLILKDGSEIELQAGARLNALGVLSADRTAMLEIWKKLTEENLSEIKIENGQGLTVGEYTGLMLISETSVVRKGGETYTLFCLREKNDMEKRMDELEEGLEIHDGAIMDMAEMLGGVMETQEGVGT